MEPQGEIEQITADNSMHEFSTWERICSVPSHADAHGDAQTTKNTRTHALAYQRNDLSAEQYINDETQDRGR